MAARWRQPPFRRASLGFLLAFVVSLLVGVVGLGDPWQEAIAPAVGTGIGLAVVFYVGPFHE